MDSDRFARRLAACASSTEEAPNGQEASEARGHPSRYVCKKRPGMGESEHDDPVIDLVVRYDVSQVEIGLVSFRHCIEEVSGKLWFADAGGDPLVLDTASSHIQLLDHAKLSYVICNCASGGGQFLDALIAGIELGRELDLLDEDLPEGEPRSLKCARIAGSEEFWPFYRDILGWGLDED